ncbi:hypothetical protein MJO28_011059 [Puccinia striiformis f. sp. tritici]|uniref:DUF7872 domain-containing protein n=4 Tax=Puccinia striiformis TaxID=27350 RepID=A0A0L0VL68_9BASI|nr:hypothetical protein Pst134EA_020771 [Puccinia striiformis f. sp. tritici]KAI9620279.1 hypothetical protein H4Q26_013849 [Puccinia striiformis f. sp. tritici PST-130]KNE99764.1 hypothetical protein PSTG_07051 [Puccinia striiformis f. sp. tritici PST-78]POW04926.1 hypothetical protein PSTT_10047 [Puccinia striiformis]KAH9447545.1 hypothetical protein Pst134EB_021558 [Puccinia striiformis f. sp. tritici]KAH9456861.1 hypothetical protein Pst134EA_020771 [Puccinia striiformis f. sp. tritici]
MRRWSCLTIAYCTFIICGAHVLGGVLQPRNLPALPPAPPPEQCPKDIPLTPETWKKLEMDNFIAGIDGIDKMTLTEFARKVGAANFFCGIGLSCNAGQLCNPVAGKNWLVLVAIQRWNSYLNSLYQGIATAVTIVRDASAEMITDFIPDTVMDKSMFGWAVATIVIGILGGFTGVLTPIYATRPALEAVEAYGSVASIASQTASNFEKAQVARNAGDLVGVFRAQQAEDTKLVATFTSGPEKPIPLPPLRSGGGAKDLALAVPAAEIVAPHRKRSTVVEEREANSDRPPALFNTSPSSFPSQPKLHQKRGAAPPSAFAYQRWAEIDTHLAALQNRLQKDVAAVSHAGINEPIYNNNGLAKVLLEGSMFQKLPSQMEDADKHKAFAKITALNEIFKAQNMFVTLGCDGCNDVGPGGAWPQDKYLSYCTADGSMRNIIMAEGIHARNEVRNAQLLQTKYGFTTELLTRKAIECQTKYGYAKDGKQPEPKDADSECVFTIPVCDCSNGVVHSKKKKGKGTVRGCRAAGVPI